MKKWLLTVVILNPYEDLNYSQINVYEIEREYAEKVIEVYEAEEPTQPENDSTEEWAKYLKDKYEDI